MSVAMSPAGTGVTRVHDGLDVPSGTGPSPYFFLSYAHTPRNGYSGQDPDYWIVRLYRDLCEHVFDLASLSPGALPGFMDRDLRQGEEWPPQLSAALATCRVFVPLYSTRYFQSMHCGKEWFAFYRRALKQAALRNGRVEAIVPALWIPVGMNELPEATRHVQFRPRDFGQQYEEHGFYGIMKVKRYRNAYQEAVYLLAKRIVDAAKTTLLEPGAHDEYHSLEPAFGGEEHARLRGRQLSLTIVAPRQGHLPVGRATASYGAGSRDWNPYTMESTRPLARYAADLARGNGFSTEIWSLFEHEAELLGDGAPPGPVVLLIDPWAVLNPEVRDKLRQLDELEKPWVRPIVIWDSQDPQMAADKTQRDLRGALDEALPRMLRPGRMTSELAVSGVPSLQDFGMVFPSVVRNAERQYLEYGPRWTGRGRGDVTQED
jgi:FxsC-like protein